MLSVLRNRTYRHLFTAQVVALTGTGLTTVALSLLAYDIAGTDAGQVLGTALAIKMVAYVLVAPAIGAFADRLPRRTLMVGADLIRAGVALCLPFVGAVWQVYVLVFLLQSASAAFTPAFQATVPEVLPKERDYTRALSLSRLAYDLESLFSPALAGLLLAVMTYNWLFTGTVLGFVGSAALVLSVALPKPTAAPRTGPGRAKVTAGSRLFLHVPQLRALLALNLAVAAASATVTVNSVVYVRGVFGLPAGALSLALGAYGAGSMAVALSLPRVLDRVTDRAVMLGGALALVVVFAGLGVVTAGQGGSWRWPALLAAWAVFGAACSMVLTPTGRLIRRSAPEAERTAAFAAQFSLSHACWLLTYPLAGWLGAAAGLIWAVAALGTIALLAAVAAVRLWPARAESPIAAQADAQVAAVGGARVEAQDGAVVEHEHHDLAPGHPHLVNALAVGTGWRHRHRLVPDALHSRH